MKDPYSTKPWRSLEEYFKYVQKYNVFGEELEELVRKEQRLTQIPYPKVKRVKAKLTP